MKIINYKFQAIKCVMKIICAAVIPAKAGIRSYNLWIPGKARNDMSSESWSFNV